MPILNKFRSSKASALTGIITTVALSIFLIFVVSACAETEFNSIGKNKIQVVATNTQIADMLNNVAGEKVTITILAKGDATFSEYLPSPSDLTALKTAQLIFRNGAGLDDWLEPVYKEAGAIAQITDLSQGIQLKDYQFDNQASPDPNPYFWHDPLNAKIMVNTITSRFEGYDPSNHGFYDLNATNYKYKIDEVTQKALDLLTTIPPEKRLLFTDNEALAYFADEFGLNIANTLSVWCGSREVPLNPELTANQTGLIKQGEISALFLDRGCAEGINFASKIAKVTEIKVIPNLYTESLSLPGREVDTYLKMIYNNALVITLGLK